MPEAYSNDLRRKFFQAYDAGAASLADVAKRFGVSESWAKKLSARRTKTGTIEIRTWRHGPPSRVTPVLREWMREQVRKQPDVTLAELQQRLQQSQGLGLSRGWVWMVVRQMGLRLKKSRSTRSSATRKPTANGGKSSWPQSARHRRRS